MDLILVVSLLFAMMLFSVLRGIFVGYPLLIGLLAFIFLARRRGSSYADSWKMAVDGARKAGVLLQIFVLIGAMTALWMAAGTVPAILYQGMRLIQPSFFLPSAFLILCGVSFLLGSSFGSISTVGVALMLVAHGIGIQPAMAAGAIISGAYFGDRCSPMSSSANFLATLTGTNLYGNVGRMLKTGVAPFLVALAGFAALSAGVPASSAAGATSSIAAGTASVAVGTASVAGGATMSGAFDASVIPTAFQIGWLSMLPALVILVFALFRIQVRLSMGVSLATAAVIAWVVQGRTPAELLRFSVFGFGMTEPGPLQTLIHGGGILSMWKVACIVALACALAGVLEGTRMLDAIRSLGRGKAGSPQEKTFSRPSGAEERTRFVDRSATVTDSSLEAETPPVASSTPSAPSASSTPSAPSTPSALPASVARPALFLKNSVLSMVTGAIGCSQTISTVLTHQLLKDEYKVAGLSDEDLALDLENTGIVMCPLIPWNIAAFVPMTMLGIDAGFIPFAFYLFAVPAVNAGWLAIRARAAKRILLHRLPE